MSALFIIDFLKVDLTTFWVSEVSFLGEKEAKRVTKLWEVDLPCLKGCQMCFASKMGSGVRCIWGFRLHLAVIEFNDSTLRVFFRPIKSKLIFIHFLLKLSQTKISGIS